MVTEIIRSVGLVVAAGAEVGQEIKIYSTFSTASAVIINRFVIILGALDLYPFSTLPLLQQLIFLLFFHLEALASFKSMHLSFLAFSCLLCLICRRH